MARIRSTDSVHAMSTYHSTDLHAHHLLVDTPQKLSNVVCGRSERLDRRSAAPRPQVRWLAAASV